jgi:hypothetical protein
MGDLLLFPTCGILSLLTNKSMKNSLKTLVVASTFVLSAVSVFAAGAASLYNGGLGQAAAKPDNFGVAVCNRDANDSTQSVPVLVAANGRTETISSAASIAAGKCEYTYLAYSDLGMQVGSNYSVTVTVNNNTADQAVYDITVPTATVAIGVGGANPATANVDQQSGNILTAIWHWFIGLFGFK